VDLAARVAQLTDAASIGEIAGGHQSRVFDVVGRDGRRVAAKVLDASLVNADDVATRATVIAELAEFDARVCRPVPIDGNLVSTLRDADGGSDGLLVCCEWADGVAFDISSLAEATLMGETLAGLHHSLRRVTPPALPVVAALRAVPTASGEPHQLLHGDFNSENLHRDGAAVRVFDFDDCGFGPRSFDVANALYMVLFASLTTRNDVHFERFQEAFVESYNITARNHAVDRTVVDGFIDVRVRALDRWLDNVDTAPIGIRTATPEWHITLREFVNSYDTRRR
jgi:Ser/Thr protein kinase RdoA (MazF antagonist)